MKQYDIYSKGAWDEFFTQEFSQWILTQADYFDSCKKQKRFQVPLIPVDSEETKNKLIFYYCEVLRYKFDERSNVFDISGLNWKDNQPEVGTSWNIIGKSQDRYLQYR